MIVIQTQILIYGITLPKEKQKFNISQILIIVLTIFHKQNKDLNIFAKTNKWKYSTIKKGLLLR